MAGIIKRNGQRSTRRDVAAIAFDWDDVNQQTEQYLEKVRKRAEAIIAEAQQQAEQIRAQSREQGKQAAIEAAEKTLRARVDQQLDALQPALDQMVQSLQASRHEWMRYWQHNAIRVACSIAEKLVQQRIADTPEIAAARIEEALELAAGSGELQLRINPEDHQALGASIERLVEKLNLIGSVEIVSDPHLTRGDCVVRTQFGEVDQQLSTQISRIFEELTAATD